MNRCAENETPTPQLMTTRLAGVSFHDRQGIIAKLRVGDQVMLLREPENPHDPNAIKVVNGAGNVIGYLPSVMAAAVALLLDQHGVPWPAQVAAINDCGLAGANVGVEVVFSDPSCGPHADCSAVAQEDEFI
jgi:single-stranded-DNA-specific exonuclease